MSENQKDSDENIYDVIIIGGGPAGLTAALYASRARLKALLFESVAHPSQMLLTDTIENYPGFPDGVSGFALMDAFKKQALSFGTEIMSANVSEIRETNIESHKAWEVLSEESAYKTYSVVIATGARPKELGVSGEIELRGKGVSYCATCDGALFKGREVVVVGGGDTAVEEAIFLTKFATKVTIVHRRNRLRATKILQERVFANEKIAFELSSVVTEIGGIEKVEFVKLKNVETNENKSFNCEGVFIFVGYNPNTWCYMGIVDTDEEGYIITNQEMATSQAGIFACGDCRQKDLRQVVNACGEGAVSAVSARHYVEGLKGIGYK